MHLGKRKVNPLQKDNGTKDLGATVIALFDYTHTNIKSHLYHINFTSYSVLFIEMTQDDAIR